jgi:hypothetical protein
MITRAPKDEPEGDPGLLGPPLVRRRRTYPEKLAILLGLAFASLVAVALIDAASGAFDSDRSVEGAVSGGMVPVHLSVEGSARYVDATLTVGANSEQFSPDVPLRTSSGALGMDFKLAPGTFVYFSGQMQDDTSQVTCALTANGRTLSTSSSSLAYGIVTCSATVPGA